MVMRNMTAVDYVALHDRDVYMALSDFFQKWRQCGYCGGLRPFCGYINDGGNAWFGRCGIVKAL